MLRQPLQPAFEKRIHFCHTHFPSAGSAGLRHIQVDAHSGHLVKISGFKKKSLLVYQMRLNMRFHTVYVHRYIVFTLKRACGISCLLYRHNSDLYMSLFKQIYNVSLAVDVKKKQKKTHYY